MNESTPSIDVILDELLDLPSTERGARLDELCGADAALRAEVASLLAAFETSGDFLERPIAQALPSWGSAVGAGRRIGAYELLESVGSGGMGDVHLARRVGHEYEQTVAIKLVRASILAPDALRRFHNECRILARLDHPNIARMIEGGIAEDGTPYLVMEYVEGRSIDVYCEEERLDLRARLRLFRDVCAAVSHLHHHSSIHRDIKPANVLVKNDGQVKLIDFSIARVLDIAEDASGDRTLVGYERMTPAYASPEQLRGEELSTATDVYSLGVLLYRILTGTLPFRGRSRDDIEREIARTTVLRPSDAAAEHGEATIDARQLRGDLDTILLMALREAPERRYSSVQHFSEDLQRYLERRPVLARGDSWSYRAGRFVRRNTAVVAVLALFVVTLVASTITAVALYAGAERARAEAVAEREAATAVGDFLGTILSSADPGAQDGGTLPTLRDVLDRASARIADELAGQATLAVDLRLTLGRAYHNLGIFDASLEQYERARAIVPANRFDLSARVDVLEAQTRMLLEEIVIADSLLARALADSTRLDAESSTMAYLARAQLANQNGEYQRAMEHARRARRLGRSLTSNVVLRVQTTSMVGEIAYRLGDVATATRSMREAVEEARASLGPRHTLTATGLQNLGIVLAGSGRGSEAIGVLEEALEVLQHAYGSEHVETANTLTSLADAQFSIGRLDAALGNYAQAGAILEQTLGPDSYRYGTVLANQASTLEKLGRSGEAERGYRDAIDVYVRSLGERHPWTAIVRVSLARVVRALGRDDETLALLDEAEPVLEESFPGGSVARARALCLRADVELSRGEVAAAGRRLQDAIEMTRALDASHPDRVAAVLLLARQRAESGRGEEARQALESHLAEMRGLADPDTASEGELRRRLAELATR